MIREAERALPQGVDVARVSKSAAGARTSVLPTSRRVTAAEAEAVAAELRERSDVVWAAPNYILTADASPPEPATDTYFVQDKNRAVWDWRSKNDSKVRAVLGTSNTFGSGGFSSRAPYAWRATKGAGAVVAVLDTGITRTPTCRLERHRGEPTHPPGPRLREPVRVRGPGRSRTPGGTATAGTPTRRIKATGSRPPATAIPAAPKEPSSWHGTHVAGIVAAGKDNGGSRGRRARGEDPPSPRARPMRWHDG